MKSKMISQELDFETYWKHLRKKIGIKEFDDLVSSSPLYKELAHMMHCLVVTDVEISQVEKRMKTAENVLSRIR